MKYMSKNKITKIGTLTLPNGYVDDKITISSIVDTGEDGGIYFRLKWNINKNNVTVEATLNPKDIEELAYLLLESKKRAYKKEYDDNKIQNPINEPKSSNLYFDI